jgi:hypothetical protein
MTILKLKHVSLKMSVEKYISNMVHPYRIGVWDGFYRNDPRNKKYEGVDSLIPNYIYRLGLSFGDFLRQTWDEVLEDEQENY